MDEVTRGEFVNKLNKHVDTLFNKVSEGNLQLNDIINLILNPKLGSSNMLTNQINDFITSHQKFLSTLTLEELGALTYISI